ncbi:MAG: hypothetical protein FGM52_00230, partial [Mycobacterium sp.]|nr:hypothetical protein [Mycobacterium sp.]
MQLSVRSYLTAGTAAVVGAGAIAIAPPIPASRHLELPLPAVAEVSLTGASFSISDIVGVLGGVLGGGGGASLPEIFGVPTDLLGV